MFLAPVVVPLQERKIINPPPSALIIIKGKKTHNKTFRAVSEQSQAKIIFPTLFIFISAFKMSHLNF